MVWWKEMFRKDSTPAGVRVHQLEQQVYELTEDARRQETRIAVKNAALAIAKTMIGKCACDTSGKELRSHDADVREAKTLIDVALKDPCCGDAPECLNRHRDHLAECLELRGRLQQAERKLQMRDFR